MQIKRYTIGSLLFIVLVGWYVYAFVSQESIGLDFFGIPLPSLSIALWVVLPLVVLYLASVVHMMFYAILDSFKLKRYEKDYAKLIDMIADAYLGKESSCEFKTPRYKTLGLLLNNSKIFPQNVNMIHTDNEKITAILKAIDTIQKGEVADLKKYALSVENQLVIQNETNRFKKGDISAEAILSAPNKYATELRQRVYLEFVKTAPLYAIEKYKEYLTKEALFEILKRVNAQKDTIEISNQALLELFSGLELVKEDFITISKLLASSMVPEHRMKLFETLSENNEEAMEAYLYTLFDLEMLAPADEILQNSQKSEYLNFKSYRALKECNKPYNIDLFI